MDYIILDIEFNGRKFASEHPMEVIEIGAVRLDASLQVKDEFSALIRPIYFSTLNSFIKKNRHPPRGYRRRQPVPEGHYRLQSVA